MEKVENSACCVEASRFYHNSSIRFADKLRQMEVRSDGEFVLASNIVNCLQTDHKTTRTSNDYRDLIDSESESEEEERTHGSFTSIDNAVPCSAKKISTEKKKDSTRVSKQEAMRRIRSESQRLCRETSVSLPYHVPKQHTLLEFLNRTKKIPNLSQPVSRAARLKMSSEVVSQALAEKEKEAESFYKSSDSEDDTQQSISLVSKNVEKSFVTNEKIASMTDIKHTGESNFDEEKKKSGPDFYRCTLDVVEIVDKQNFRPPQCNSVVSDKNRDNNLTAETIEISETFNNINNKEMTQVLQGDFENCVTDATVTFTNSSGNIITQDKNNEAKDKQVETDYTSSSHTLVKQIGYNLLEIQDNSVIKNCHKANSHVLGLPLPNFMANQRKLSEFTSNSKVTLKGSPGMIIDLSDDAKSNTKGANTLLDRFFSKHVNTKKQTDNKSEVSVLYLEDTQNGPIPTKEVLPYKFPTNTEHNPELDKPGAKLRRLKQSLKLQMNQKRAKEWEQRKEKLQTQEEEKWSDEEDLDAQEENDMRLSYSSESEPEENDVCIKDKKRRKCLFADDEAQETDDEGSDINAEDIYDESDTGQMEYGERSRSSERKKEYVDDSETESCEDFEDKENLDTDIEDGNVSDVEDNDDLDDCEDDNIIRNGRNRIRTQSIQEFEDDSNSIDPNDLENGNRLRSQACKTPSTKTSMLDFVSPITQLSVLNTTLDSNKKVLSEKTEYLIDEHKFVSMENTQNDKPFKHVRDIEKKNIFKKKLFDDTGETVDDEYLMQLCSGKFESTQRTDLNFKNLSSQLNTSESQLLELRNGNFCTKQDDIKQSESSEVRNESSQDIKLTLDEDSVLCNSVNQTTAIKEISALSSKRKLRIASSDDEDEADKYYKPKTRLTRRWNLSDSEEEEVNPNVCVHFSEEESENDDVESVNDDDEKTEQYIDYDSEENEVTVVPKKNLKNVVADFLEEEAELSESDWDSADEDEKGMDKLEFEEADEEQLDEYEVKNQLEKMHAKQMLDEHKRDIRIMKELLFEDGDLYTDGTGRERKFKWRNIDKLGNNMEMPQALDENDGWVDVQEDEEEAQWNKLRQERDKFLEEKMKSSSNEVEDELCSSQIFKRGLLALKKVKYNEPQKQDASPNKKDSSENMEPIMPRNLEDFLNGPNAGKKSQTIYNVIQKRSLLTRGEESLARIASLAKQSDSTSHAAGAKNFVFPSIEPQIDDDAKNENKIKEEDRNLKAKKRAITSDFSSATKRQRI
nr:PREDICTED: claspin homolog [Linepithema humile]